MARLHWLILIGAIALLLAAGVRPGAAMVIYPWCVQYGGISYHQELRLHIISAMPGDRARQRRVVHSEPVV